MTSNELKQLRVLLFLDVAEAAKHIGHCEPRTWQRWERGDRAIPNDVIGSMQMLALSRMELLAVEFDESDPMYRYFDDYQAFYEVTGASVVKWRLAQSVSAALLCERSARRMRDEEIVYPEE